MPALRILGGIFVAAAGVLAVAALISQQSQNQSNAGQPAAAMPRIEFTWTVPGASQPSVQPQVAMRGSEPENETRESRIGQNGKREDGMRSGRRTHRHRAVAVAAEHHRSKHHHRQSELANLSASTVSEGSAPAAPSLKKTPPRYELTAVEERLRRGLSDELYADFRLFLYVSKAATGPVAQQMYVFRKADDGSLDLLYNWPVSTGRDRTEMNGEGLELSTFTPTGYFKLDPHRFFRHHTSGQWHEPMPFAMFFDWKDRGTPTGLAIHAATGSDIQELGKRASAGCIRLAPDAAKTLFNLVRTEYRGLTPTFAVDHRTGTMSDDGIVLHSANGRAEMSEGYRVLVMIENYGGGNLVAAMY